MADNTLNITSELAPNQLDGLRAEAARLREELESLQSTSAVFARNLAALDKREQTLAKLGRQSRQTAKAQAELAQSAGQATGAQREQDQAAEASAERARERQARQLEAEQQFAEARLETQQAFLAQSAEAQIASTDRKLQDMERLRNAEARQLNFEQSLNEARLEVAQAGQEAFGALNAAFGEGRQQFSAAQKALFLFSKALAIRDVIVNTQKEIGTIQATYAAAPPVAAALTAKAVASGALRVATISAQTVPELAGGGILQGPSHAGGGIPLTHRQSGRPLAEAEGGEVVLTKAVSQRPALLAMASRINQLAGGVSLTPPPVQTRMAGGGVAGAGDDRFFRSLERLAERPAVVSVEEIRRVSSRVDVLERNAGV